MSTVVFLSPWGARSSTENETKILRKKVDYNHEVGFPINRRHVIIENTLFSLEALLQIKVQRNTSCPERDTINLIKINKLESLTPHSVCVIKMYVDSHVWFPRYNFTRFSWLSVRTKIVKTYWKSKGWACSIIFSLLHVSSKVKISFSWDRRKKKWQAKVSPLKENYFTAIFSSLVMFLR